MSKRLKNNVDYLKVLHKSNNKIRSAILQNANKELLLCICECVENILNGNVRITPNQRKQLKKYVTVLRKIRDKGTKLGEKKTILVQKGGFLGALLAPIITALAGTVLGSFVK